MTNMRYEKANKAHEYSFEIALNDEYDYENSPLSFLSLMTLHTSINGCV